MKDKKKDSIFLDPRFNEDKVEIHKSTMELIKIMLKKAIEAPKDDISHGERARVVDCAQKYLKMNQTDPEFIRIAMQGMSEEDKRLYAVALSKLTGVDTPITQLKTEAKKDDIF